LAGLVLAVCVACASETKSVRSLDELPPQYRTAWEAWLTDDPEWPTMRQAVQNDPALTRFMVDNLVRVMVRAYDRAELADHNAEKLGRFERARAELIVMKADALPVLIELLAIADGVVAQLTESLLVELGRDALEPARGLLRRDDHLVRLRGLDLVQKLPHALEREAELQAQLAQLLASDPAWAVRAKAAETLARRAAKGRDLSFARRELSRALSDDESMVAQTAVRGLRALGDPEAIPALINYLERSARAQDARALKLTVGALGALSGGQALGIDGRAWRAWWRDARPERP